MRQTPERNGIHLGDLVCDRLAFADDIDFCGEGLQDINESLLHFRNAAKHVGLEISQQKTKIMKVTRHEKVLGNIRCGNMDLEAVDNFKYLGSTVTAENRVEEEVKLRIATAARCSWSMNKILTSNMLSRKTKLKTYAAIIRPILTYGCETWRLTRDLERKLELF